MTIFQATLKDLPKLVPLFDGYRQFYKQASDLEGATQFLEQRLINQDAVIFIITVGDEYAGFTQLYPIFSSKAMQDAYLLNDLFIAPEFRRSGIAEQLMRYTFAFAKEEGANFVMLETAVDNIKAQALYEKVGMIRDTERYYYAIQP
ncbi:N-acetyltransferase [Lysinibacillus alkalisoli]|uniref:N-acetyltransferase n=1 Tax=Lysinibacillus alkalisoli TaxID=1911548 RepID=A0A917LEQ5_9BACI|nr:GNAT family N-acetyltransferase [Lysinibacillus alkalisoli]GGG15857.1 N-acetyltransferase [Lysinibacillus alkalisoli]